MKRNTHTRRGFGLLELILGIITLGVFLVSLLIVIPTKQRELARQLKDSTQVRKIQQGLVVWSQNNQDIYPIPSKIDVNPEHQTSAGDGKQKDTTRNIVSLLIYTQCVDAAECVSPSEVNTKIKLDKGYTYAEPPVAKGDPKRALWDPTFTAYPDDALASVKPIARSDGIKSVGGFSYAHVIPFAGRSHMWTSTFMQSEAVVGNRGPTYRFGRDGWVLSNAFAKGGVGPAVRGTASNTLRIHGKPNVWEGNIAYNDNHVNFESTPDPEDSVFTFGAGSAVKRLRDNLFVAERNDSLERTPQPEDLSTPEGMNGKDNLLRGFVDVGVGNGEVQRITPFFD